MNITLKKTQMILHYATDWTQLLKITWSYRDSNERKQGQNDTNYDSFSATSGLTRGNILYHFYKSLKSSHGCTSYPDLVKLASYRNVSSRWETQTRHFKMEEQETANYSQFQQNLNIYLAWGHSSIRCFFFFFSFLPIFFSQAFSRTIAF